MIPRASITAWRKAALWPDNTQVEQDLVLSRALVELFRRPAIAEGAVFRGGTALHKLFFDPPGRYSEDIDLVQRAAGPIGYDVVDKKLVVNELEAVVVRELFSLYEQHRSAMAVARLLNKAGRTTKRHQANNGNVRAGKPWTKDAVLRVLREIPDHRLAPAFAQAAETEPRRLVENLLAADRFDELFHYLSDEYWRLGLLFDAGEVREALVGLVGLAELAVDGMFRAPWFAAARIARATAVEWLGVADSVPLPALNPWKGQTVPIGCLPPSSFGPKVRLLRRGATTFDIWGWPTQGGAELRSEAPGWNDARLVARVDVALDPEVRPPLGGPSNRIWKGWFGDFPQGGWVQNRHALAHLRAPLLAEKAVAQAAQARDVFVPRLIEVLRRLHAGEPLDVQSAEEADWTRWQQMSPWRKEDRMPWIAKLSDLERWLRLGL